MRNVVEVTNVIAGVIAMKRVAIRSCLSLAAAAALSALAEPMVYRLPPETAELKPGPGVETAALCQACHSADYIARHAAPG